MLKGLLIGMIYIAAMNDAMAAQCIFGTELGELEENRRFRIEADVIKTFKVSRIAPRGQLIMVSIDVLFDKKTKREYHVNTTFRHRDDGDNTIGWIEEVTGAANSDSGVRNEGRIVAEIGDSSFEKCRVLE